MINLDDEDDPNALVAMLRFCYEGTYVYCSSDKSPADDHITMYRLGDLYDISVLRQEASSRFIAFLGPVEPGWDCEPGADGPLITGEIIHSVQQILGPDADSFADNSIQQHVYKHVIKHITLFYKNAHFRDLLANGSMFNESFARKFTDEIGEILSFHYHHRRCHCSYPPSPLPDWSTAPMEVRW